MTDVELKELRRDYGGVALEEDKVPTTPYILFEDWLQKALDENILDAQCFVLSTVDTKGVPDSRVVLLKEIKNNKLIFYTNYESQKAIHIEKNNQVSLNFYWASLSRQVRIKGTIQKVSNDYSQSYFKTRPADSQISAIVSPQSQVIKSREMLEGLFEEYSKKQSDIKCPEYWGGYAITPFLFEFFQGRTSRLHDRLQYVFSKKKWILSRLAP